MCNPCQADTTGPGSIAQRGSGPVAGRPKLAEGCMHCLLLCSGAGEPTPVGASVQSLPSGHNRPWFYCRAREHRSPPCAKGGQHGRAMQGGLQSQANDSAGCCDRVRERSMPAQALGRRHSANPSVDIRRQLPLHKGAIFAAQHTTGPGSVAGRGSAVWVQRHAGTLA